MRTRRGMLPPQSVDKDIAGHRLVRAEEENREQRPLLLAADIEGMAVNAGLDRSRGAGNRSLPWSPTCTPRTALLTVAARTGYRKPQVSGPASRCELFVRSRREDQATASRGLGAGMKRTGSRSLYPGPPVIAAFAVTRPDPGLSGSRSQAPRLGARHEALDTASSGDHEPQDHRGVHGRRLRGCSPGRRYGRRAYGSHVQPGPAGCGTRAIVSHGGCRGQWPDRVFSVGSASRRESVRSFERVHDQPGRHRPAPAHPRRCRSSCWRAGLVSRRRQDRLREQSDR